MVVTIWSQVPAARRTYHLSIDTVFAIHEHGHALDEVPARHPARRSRTPRTRAWREAHGDRKSGFIFATATKNRAEIVTADADFEGLPSVILIR
jgi:hypothetical protein